MYLGTDWRVSEEYGSGCGWWCQEHSWNEWEEEMRNQYTSHVIFFNLFGVLSKVRTILAFLINFVIKFWIFFSKGLVIRHA